MTAVGIVANLTKDINLNLTKQIVKWLEKNECRVLLPEIIASQIDRIELGYQTADIYKGSDFIVVLGGDGTLLGVSRQVSWLETPFLGVNMGHLGFMTDVETKEVFDALEKIISGNYHVEERMMLEAIVMKDDIQTETFYCLNEIGISKGTLSRILTLKTYIDDNYVDTYNADGLLISTPTGSTAYSLSAGGPIISPRVSVMLITPICPHSLNARALVVSPDEIVRVEIVDNYQEVFLTADGQQGYKLKSGDQVIIRKAPFSAKLIKVSNRSFYDVLRKKLKERFI